MVKVVSLIICCLSIFTGANAQPGDPYAAQWKKIAELENKGLTADALKEADKILKDATIRNFEAQQVKAVMHIMKYRNSTEEESIVKNISFLDTLINKAKTPAKNIYQSMQAQLFQSYRNANRYRLYNRTDVVNQQSDDIKTWSLQRLNERIAFLFEQSLHNDAVLKATPVEKYEAILDKGINGRMLRPALFDLLAHRAVDYFTNQENDVTQPAYKFTISDNAAFEPARKFASHRFQTKDTASLYYKAIVLFQEIIRFHADDARPDALIDADLRRLEFIYNYGVMPGKEELYEHALEGIEQKYSQNPASAQAGYLRAKIYFEKGEKFNYASNWDGKDDLIKAVSIAEETYRKHPDSEGGINVYNLTKSIQTPSLQFKVEKVNIPGQPFRSLAEYKNTGRIYFRIIKTTRDEINRINKNDDYEKRWPSLLALKPLQSWQQDVPDTKDYQEHGVELRIDALAAGTYFIIASLKENFSLKENIIASSVTYVSNLSYIANSKNNLYVLNRDNGQPVAGVTVQRWQSTYDYSLRRNVDVKRASYVTDKDGAVKFAPTKNYEESKIQLISANDELFTDDGIYNFNYDSYRNRKETKKTFLFTDRSIYRPGQTVFFKGVMTTTDSSGRNSSVVAGRKTAIQLFDANRQKIDEVLVTTNDYGSVSGSFILPQGLLNGNFSLFDTLTKSAYYFSVEEYKRPKFFTEIKKPEGSYRVNDSITVKGSAKAYAGNSISGAKVSYRVVRVVRYPVWWGYYRGYYPQNNNQMEIANGVLLTNEQGDFQIRFKAIPDETVDKKSRASFDYRISVDITDLNGETRSGTEIVTVSFNAVQLNISAEEIIPADSIKNIRISSRNVNGLFEKTTVNFSMYKLIEPEKIFRSRYWPVPDQFVMTKEEFYRQFPYDPYADEEKMVNWSPGPQVINVTDTTSATSVFPISGKNLKAGWYKIVVTGKDKFGEEVKDEKFIQVTTKEPEKIKSAVLLSSENNITEPGEKIEYKIETGFDKVWLIHSITKADESIKVDYPTAGSDNAFTNTLNVRESDRGGIHMNYAFVKHNRVYTGNEIFLVPWSNKELQISYETFRDKLLPGAKEQWKIKISGSKAEKVAAEALIGMYDASLDQFKPQSWSSFSSLYPNNNAYFGWFTNDFSSQNSEENANLSAKYIDVPDKSYDALRQEGWSYSYGEYERAGMADGVMYKSAMPSAAAPPSPPSQSAGRQTGGMAFEKKAADVLKNSPSVQVNDSTESAADNKLVGSDNVTLRKNFNETAFFFPALTTDAEGNISFSFTIPEALTKWKMMVMAHTKDLASAYSEKTTITQKDLMVQPNAPRFMREGDRMEFTAKIVNLSGKEITGTSQLELIDAATDKPVDGWMKNVFPNQYFTVAAGQSALVKFPIEIPFSFNSVLKYRIRAVSKDGSFSDGEEMAIPVLTNRMLVTETLPLNMRNTNSKLFRFDKLLNSAGSGTLTNQSITVEYTTNPVWYAVQALPYLMEYPFECAEQSFNRYYANSLASFIANSNPRIKAVFDKWKITDTTALMSNLQKNQELKSVLLEETPWVLDAKDEAQQKKNIALLFDLIRLSAEKNKNLATLKDLQTANGGFAWFKGGRDDRFITQYIISGIGHLRKLKGNSDSDYALLLSIVKKALPYLDARIKEDYDDLLKYKVKMSDNHLSYTAVQYLYMRSFFSETPVSKSAETAVNYYRNQSATFWLSQNRYVQAMIALAMHRGGKDDVAKAIIKSLDQNSIKDAEQGMYWKDLARGGYYWYQAPVESQAMIIEAFKDISGDRAVINDLQTWLILQKQTNRWPSTKATAEACYALLLNNDNLLSEDRNVVINLGNTVIRSVDRQSEAGTGYFKQTIAGDKVQQGMGNITVTVSSPANQNNTTTSFGAVYWQYFEDLDKITSAETGLKILKKLFIEKNSDKGPVLVAVKEGDELKIGDKIKVRIELRSDRDLEYVHMKDMRASAFEPVNVTSSYKWQGGLGYYESTKDASTNFFFDHLFKGTYVFEYPVFVTHAGNFSNGITTIQCMYAPEFTSHSDGVRVSVAD